MRGLVREAGLEREIEVESAGLGDWHVGQGADRRAAEAAGRRGLVLEGTARQVTPDDFAGFDLLLAMDRSNERELRALAPDARAAEKVKLLRAYDPASAGAADLDVPDPFYGGAGGFETVLDLVEAACRGLLDSLR
jgi:protein-tyrosine phosphatase